MQSLGRGRDAFGATWCSRFGGRKSHDLRRPFQGYFSWRPPSTLVVAPGWRKGTCLAKQTGFSTNNSSMYFTFMAQSLPFLSAPCPLKLIVGDNLVHWQGTWVLPLAGCHSTPPPSLFSILESGDNVRVLHPGIVGRVKRDVTCEGSKTRSCPHQSPYSFTPAGVHQCLACLPRK